MTKEEQQVINGKMCGEMQESELYDDDDAEKI